MRPLAERRRWTPSQGRIWWGLSTPRRRVLIDPQLLATLPLRELRAGFAEIIKHGVIADEPYLFQVASSDFDKSLSTGGSMSDRMVSLIVRSVEIKAEVVSRDEREEGLRKVLNFGHTIGHAVEWSAAARYSMERRSRSGWHWRVGWPNEFGLAQTGTAAAVIRTLQAAALRQTSRRISDRKPSLRR